MVNKLAAGIPTPLKNNGVKVSWDDEIPNWMENHKIPWFQTTNQLKVGMLKTNLHEFISPKGKNGLANSKITSKWQTKNGYNVGPPSYELVYKPH